MNRFKSGPLGIDYKDENCENLKTTIPGFGSKRWF